jgi:hypothetical protein
MQAGQAKTPGTKREFSIMSHEMQTDFSPLCNYSLIIIHQEQMQFGKKELGIRENTRSANEKAGRKDCRRMNMY